MTLHDPERTNRTAPPAMGGFNRWEEQQPPLEREPGQILADLGAILRWIPEEDRLHDPDRETRVRAGFVGSGPGSESPAMTELEASVV